MQFYTASLSTDIKAWFEKNVDPTCAMTRAEMIPLNMPIVGSIPICLYLDPLISSSTQPTGDSN